MLIIEQIKQDLTAARKARDEKTVRALSSLYGEMERIGKDKGNRATTDDEAIPLVKKFISNNEEILRCVISNNARDATLFEIATYNKYVPKQLSEQQIKEIITGLGTMNLGEVMKHFKTTYNGQYDGKLVSQIVKAESSRSTTLSE